MERGRRVYLKEWRFFIYHVYRWQSITSLILEYFYESNKIVKLSFYVYRKNNKNERLCEENVEKKQNLNAVRIYVKSKIITIKSNPQRLMRI